MLPPIPRVTYTQHRFLSGDDTLHVSLLSDLHLDSAACDFAGLKRLMRERAALPNHVVVILGDVCDLVMPPDLRRFRQSGQLAEIATRDDWFQAAVEAVGDKLADLGVQIILIARGNHEDEALKRHGWDATSILAARLHCAQAGYSGVHDFRLFRNRCQSVFRLAYHHGAWGGSASKGYLGALPWFNSIDSWHCAAWGHNHACRVDPEVRLSPDPGAGVLRERQVYLVNCSSWTYGATENARVTAYTERHGYRPQPRKSPLIKVRLTRERRATHGKEASRLYPEYTVEV